MAPARWSAPLSARTATSQHPWKASASRTRAANGQATTTTTRRAATRPSSVRTARTTGGSPAMGAQLTAGSAVVGTGTIASGSVGGLIAGSAVAAQVVGPVPADQEVPCRGVTLGVERLDFGVGDVEVEEPDLGGVDADGPGAHPRLVEVGLIVADQDGGDDVLEHVRRSEHSQRFQCRDQLVVALRQIR